MNDFKGRYLGFDKIIKSEKAKRKTYLGNEVVTITLENKTTKEIPLEMLNLEATKEKSDLTKLRDLMTDPVIGKIVAILLESEVVFSDIDYIFTKTVGSLNNHLERANAILWGKELYQRTLMDINNVIAQNGQSQTKR